MPKKNKERKQQCCKDSELRFDCGDNQSGVLESNLLQLGLAWRESEFKPVTSFLELKTASNYQANES